MGARLSYLMWCDSQKAALAELVEHELALVKRAPYLMEPGRTLCEGVTPSPLTGSVRIQPGNDPLLRLQPDAIERLVPVRRAAFDPTRPAVSIAMKFLGAARDLPPLGMIPAVQAGDLFFGWVNLHMVPVLAHHKAVVHIETLRAGAPTSNSVDDSSDPNRQRSAGDDRFTIGSRSAVSSLKGRGVRLAVIDLGFDFLHPALMREVNGIQQVRALWLHDMQLQPEQSDPAGALGRRFTTDDLKAARDWYLAPLGPNPQQAPSAIKGHLGRLKSAIVTSEYKQLLQQHGTALTGIAAGSGLGGNNNDPTPPFSGIAPEANLVLIAIGAHDETRFADSIEVISAFQAAFEDLNAPCVALMANSDSLGPHDGSLDGERFLDELLLLPGRAIVLTAGNLNHISTTDGQVRAFHAVVHAGPENVAHPEPLVLRYSEGASVPDSAEVWFRPPPAANPARAIISFKELGTAMEPLSVPVTDGADWVSILKDDQNSAGTTVIAQLLRDEEADAHCLQLIFRPAKDREIVKSEWTINVTAEGPVHGWLDRNNLEQKCWVGAPALAGAGNTTLGSPASAIRPITVGSVASNAGKPSTFSGRGPLRAPLNAPRKPDLVAVGENASGPNGDPSARVLHHASGGPAYTKLNPPNGTSYAAPQVAGACALLFERFGPAATWADIRQAILQATKRTDDMPKPDDTGWDNACGFGLLCLDTLLSPPMPDVDIWLPKTPKDDGTEPFVDWTFWNSPALVLEDAAGQALDPAKVATGRAKPKRLRVRVGNRGKRPADNVVLSVWWAPLGAAYPLPHPENAKGAWSANGFGGGDLAPNRKRLAGIASGDFVEAVFEWTPQEKGPIVPPLLLATVDTVEDPFVATDTACAHNNVAMLNTAAIGTDGTAEFQIFGSEDTDGLILWCDSPKSSHPVDPPPVRIDALPITALPWRDAAMFEKSGRSDRPLCDSQEPHKEDMAVEFSRGLDGSADITEITEVLNADKLQIENGKVTIRSQGRLILPRLRIAPGAPLMIKAKALDRTAVAIHMLHLSGGRRVGGGSVQIVPQ